MKAPPTIKRQLELIASNHARRVSEVFGDWCAAMALGLANAAAAVQLRPDMATVAAREAEYMRIVKRYDGPTMTTFAELLGALTLAMDADPCDQLGTLYMELGSPNERLGQFFTPPSISRMMAELMLGDVDEVVKVRGFVSVSEPACGSGGMVLASSETMRERGLNPQTQMPVHAIDLGITAVHMAYVQFSILGLPALVVHGNTLTLDVMGVWRTAAWNLGLWDLRAPFSAAERELPPPPADPVPAGQLDLF